MKFCKKPIEISAIRWDGDNLVELTGFTSDQFRRAAPDTQIGDLTAEVYDDLHSVWVPLRTGDWIIRGVRGEFYPCEASVFVDTYDPVEAAGAAG